mgnify:CR=1 FL=1
MRDLCAQTGLERQTIHYYIQEGLMPEGKKTGKNSALYGEEHLERLQLIRRLQRERFLPLRAIRAVLGGKASSGWDQSFSREQRALLSEVRRHLERTHPSLVVSKRPRFASVSELAARTDVSPGDIAALAEGGFVSLSADGRQVRADDVWLVELWGELRRAGLSEARGFGVHDIAAVDEALSELFARERMAFLERLSGLGASEIAAIVSRTLPLLGRLLSGLYMKKATDTLLLGDHDPPAKKPSKRSAA